MQQVNLTKDQQRQAKQYYKAKLLAHLNGDAQQLFKVLRNDFLPQQLDRLGLTSEVIAQYQSDALRTALFPTKAEQ